MSEVRCVRRGLAAALATPHASHSMRRERRAEAARLILSDFALELFEH